MIPIVRLYPDDWRRWRSLRLEALRDAPHAFRATLDDWQGPADLETRWRDRLSGVPCNVLALFDGRDAGICSGTTPSENAVELISMWVAPFARRHGVADALVDAVLGWAKTQDVSRVKLAVFEDNASALSLYRRHGFRDLGSVAENGAPHSNERLMAKDLRS